MSSMEQKIVETVKDLQRRVDDLEAKVAQLQRLQKGESILTNPASNPAERGKPVSPSGLADEATDSR